MPTQHTRTLTPERFFLEDVHKKMYCSTREGTLVAPATMFMVRHRNYGKLNLVTTKHDLALPRRPRLIVGNEQWSTGSERCRQPRVEYRYRKLGLLI
jgi:hypothetical protein